MLKPATKEKLKLFKIDVDKLEAAIKDDKEVDFDMPDGEILTTDELITRDANKVTEGEKEGIKKGEKKILDVIKKEADSKLGLKSKAERAGDFVEELSTHLNSSTEGKLTALQEQNKALLVDKASFEAKLADTEKMAKNAVFDAELISLFPSNRGNDLSDKERLLLIKATHEFEHTDTGTQVKKGGQLLTDKATHGALPLDKVVGDIFTERKWIGATAITGGRGGNNSMTGISLTAGIKSIAEAQKVFQEANPDKNIVSPEFEAFAAQVMKDNPEVKG